MAILGRNLEYRILIKLLYFYSFALVGINILIYITARDIESFKLLRFFFCQPVCCFMAYSS